MAALVPILAKRQEILVQLCILQMERSTNKVEWRGKQRSSDNLGTHE